MSESKYKNLAAKRKQWHQWKGFLQGGKGRSMLKSRVEGPVVREGLKEQEREKYRRSRE